MRIERHQRGEVATRVSKRRRFKSGLISVGTVALLVAGVVGCAANPNTQNTAGTQGAASTKKPSAPSAKSAPATPLPASAVVVTYTGGKVTKGELDKYYNMLIVLGQVTTPPSKAEFATSYVTLYHYLYDEAVKGVKTKIDPAMANQMTSQYMSQLQQQYQTQAAVDKKMKSLGLTKADVVSFMKKYAYVSTYVQEQTSNVSVTSKEIDSYYKQHQSDFVDVTVDQILVKTLATAQKVEADLKKGQSFAKLADKYSIDPSAKQNHGHLPSTPVSQYVPQFADACLKLKIGQISTPVHTQYGYHVLRVDARTTQTLKKAQPQIQQTLMQNMAEQKQLNLLQTAQKGANVKFIVSKSQL